MSNVLPVITLYQPWATWVARGWKPIETRTHERFKCLFNQEFLIHAGMKTDGSHYAVNNPFLSKEEILFEPDEMVNGAILCKVFCWHTAPLDKSDSEYALIDCDGTGRYGLWVNVLEKFEQPIYVKGEMGIWYYDLDKREKVRKSEKQKIQTTLF